MKRAFVGTRQAAEFLGSSQLSVRALCRAGKLPAVRIGPLGDFRIPIAALDALVQSAMNDDDPAATGSTVKASLGVGEGDAGR
jgi:excisionase family DNA binding protein